MHLETTLFGSIRAIRVEPLRNASCVVGKPRSGGSLGTGVPAESSFGPRMYFSLNLQCTLALTEIHADVLFPKIILCGLLSHTFCSCSTAVRAVDICLILIHISYAGEYGCH